MALLAFASICIGAVSALAQTSPPHVGEFRVNSVGGPQNFPIVATKPDGSFVAVYGGRFGAAVDSDVYARLFDAAGQPRGDEFRVNTITTGDQWDPAVAMGANGNFVISWQSSSSSSDTDIKCRAYSASGAAITGEMQVHETTAEFQLASRVVMDAVGNFVVVYNSGSSVRFKRYNASGVAQGTSVFVAFASLTSDFAAAGNAAGQFVIMTQDGFYRFGGDGQPITSPPFRVDGKRRALSLDDEGAVTVVWQNTGWETGLGIRMMRINAQNEVSGPTAVNTFTASDQQFAAVSCNGAGQYVVAWQSTGQDGSGYGMYAQRYTKDGVKLGEEFRLNTSTLGDQDTFWHSHVAMAGDGSFVSVWRSSGLSAEQGVFGDRFLPMASPPDVSTIPAASVTATAATLRGRITSNAAEAQTYFERGDRSGETQWIPGTPATVPPDGVGVEFTAQLTGLSPHTQYSFRAIGRNTAGTSFGSTVSFSTINRLPEPVADVLHPPAGFGAFRIPVLANDTDPDGDTLTLIGADSPQGGSASIDGTAIVYTPGPSYTGTDSFSYFVADGFGGLVQSTVTLTNANPVVTVRSGDAVEDTPVGFSLEASDADGDALSYSVGVPAHGTVSGVGPDFVYAPAANYFGPDSFTYAVTDGHGGITRGVVTLQVAPVNDAPVATAQILSATEDIAKEILLTAVDVDGDALKFAIEQQPTRGTLTGTLPNVIYTPAANANGPDSFVFSVSDGNGGVANATVKVQVNSVNDVPLANDDLFHPELAAGPIALSPLGNDSDVDEGAVLKIVAAAGAEHGQLSVDDRTIFYTPGPSYTGNDHFTYTITDEAGGTASATVTLQNAQPAAGDDTFHLPIATAPWELDVLPNDSDRDAGDALRISSVGVSQAGQIEVSRGKLRYTPGEAFDGNDTFTYTVTDDHGAVTTATVRLRNAVPTAVADTATTSRSPVEIAVLANDFDADGGDVLRIAAVTNGARGTVAIHGSSVTYSPGPEFRSSDAFTYTVEDSAGGRATGTVSLSLSETVRESAAATGGQVPGERLGTVWKTFGLPSINDSGEVAFAATVRSAEGDVGRGVFSGFVPAPLARAGDPAPGIDGAIFKSFKDPVLNANGGVAFLAAVTGGSQGPAAGVWSNTEGGLVLVVREGDVAPGVPGATFRKIQSIALPDTGRLIFVATLRQSGRRVTGGSDLGIWTQDVDGSLRLVLREGQTLEVRGTTRKVKTATLLAPVAGSPDQRRAFGSAGELRARVVFTDGSEAILGTTPGGVLEVIALSDDVPEALGGAAFERFGTPTIADDGGTVFRAELTPASAVASFAIMEINRDDQMRVIARSGSVAPDAGGALFLSFAEPVAAEGATAVLGALAPGAEAPAPFRRGIWSDVGGGLELVAGEGAPAPGAPGTIFKSFPALALPGSRGVAFVAKLAAGERGSVTPASDLGLWAQDRTGALQLLLREGGANPAGTARLRTFSALASVSGSPGAGHSYSRTGGFVSRLIWSDGQQEIVTVWVP